MVEDLDTKRQVFKLLDQVCKDRAVLSTSTLSVPIGELAAATRRADKVIATRYFHPVHTARLIEVVRDEGTSAETVATATALAQRLGKVAVVMQAGPGYVANRIFSAIVQQSCYLVEEGAWPQHVDEVLYDFGFPMGPFAAADSIGLDIVWRVRQADSALRSPDERYSPLIDRLCALGRFGHRSGAGWYSYDLDRRMAFPDEQTQQLILERSAETGTVRREVNDREIPRALHVRVDR